MYFHSHKFVVRTRANDSERGSTKFAIKFNDEGWVRHLQVGNLRNSRLAICATLPARRGSWNNRRDRQSLRLSLRQRLEKNCCADNLRCCATPEATLSFRIEGYMFVFDGAIRCRPCLLTQSGGAFYVRRRDADDAIHYRR